MFSCISCWKNFFWFWVEARSQQVSDKCLFFGGEILARTCDNFGLKIYFWQTDEQKIWAYLCWNSSFPCPNPHHFSSECFCWRTNCCKYLWCKDRCNQFQAHWCDVAFWHDFSSCFLLRLLVHVSCLTLDLCETTAVIFFPPVNAIGGRFVIGCAWLKSRPLFFWFFLRLLSIEPYLQHVSLWIWRLTCVMDMSYL